MNMDKDTPTMSVRTGEFIPYADNHRSYIQISPSLSPTRAYASPLMGKSARAAKRRLDAETRPTRIDGIDSYNHPPQHHYQNVGRTMDDPKRTPPPDESGQQTFSAKRDFFEERFKSSAPTYDSPPREQQPLSPKIVTTITTTTTTPSKLLNRNSLPSTGSAPSFDRLLEQAAELQKRTQDNTNQNSSQQSLVIERTEQCQVYLDRTNRDPHQTSPVLIRKTGHATDLDQAQSQVNRLTDDHQAIQQLTRVLQEHQPGQNQYTRLSSPANPVLINTTTTTTTTIPTDLALVDRTNKTAGSEFTVIDALLDNPLGTTNSKQNDTLHQRFNNIISNLQNSDYVSVLRRSLTRESKRKKSQKPGQTSESVTEPTSEQTALIDSKQDKKNKKKNKNKSKKSKYTNYQVIDAIINSPIILRLPESFLRKYNVRPPASQLSPTPLLGARDSDIRFHKQFNNQANNQTEYSLVNVVDELMLHHATALNRSAPTGIHGRQQQMRSNHFNDGRYSQRPGDVARQSEMPVKPRIVYRYLDEQGNILKYSSVPPSQLRETAPSQPPRSALQNIEPKYFNSRQIVRDSPRHYSTADRRTWQDQTELSSVRREEPDFHQKRRSEWSGKSSPTFRAVPISIERDHTRRTPSLQQRQHRDPSQSNVKLAWLPLSSQLDQPYIPGGAVDYDTDSTTSDHSTTYRTYDYKSVGAPQNNRPFFRHDYYQNRSPSLTYNTSPARFSYDNRTRSPDYSSASISRNYIEVFRDGAAKPSEIYSLPLNEPIRKIRRHSRYDKHQAEKSGRTHTSSVSKHKKGIPSSSSTSNHDSHYSPATPSSPIHDGIYSDNTVPPPKSFDYRPLRTKLQREYKITPSLLVDEWDHPEQTRAGSYKTTSVSLPDDVFLKNKSSNHTNGHTEQQSWISRPDATSSNRQRLDQKISVPSSSGPIYKALALHNFYAQTSRELSFKKGDILLVRRRINDDWLEGEFQDSVGIFPLNHVELFPLEVNEQENVSSDYEFERDDEGEAIVKYDFIPQKTFELQLRKGDKVILLRRLDENWYEGRLNHTEGIFPAAYVETLREPPDNLSGPSQQIEHVSSPKQASPDPEPIAGEKLKSTVELSSLMRRCQVLYDYTPQNPDELEIHVGDIITIIEMCDDGWYCGMMENPSQRDSMEFGTFPGNYVKLLP